MNSKLPNENRFIDPDMYEHLSIFSQKEMTHKNQISVVSNINRSLSPVLYRKKIKDLNTEWLVTLDEKGLIPSGGGAILCRFIGYLIDNKIIRDEGLKRIVECKGLFYRIAVRGQISTLLTTPIYGEFKRKYDLEDKKVISILACPQIQITDDHVCSVLNTFMDSIKISDSFAISTKGVKLSDFNQIVRGLFRRCDISQLSMDSLQNYIQTNSLEQRQKSILVEILIKLKEESLLHNTQLNHFLSEIEKVTHQLMEKREYTLSKFTDLLPNFTNQSKIFIKKRNGSISWINFKCSIDSISMFLGEFYGHSTYSDSIFNNFFIQYENSLKDTQVSSLDDLTYKVFRIQITYFRKKFNSQKYIRHLIGFYQFLLQKNAPIFQDVKDSRFLNRVGLARELHKGFDVIFYQPLENLPESDKWILSYTEHQCTNEGVTPSMTYRIDFTKINNKKLSNALKHYIWYHGSSINNKLTQKKYILKLLKFIENYSNENIKKLSKSNDSNLIDLGMILAFKHQVLDTYTNNRTRLGHIYAARDFLKYCQMNSLIEIDKGYEYYLSYTRDTTYNSSQPITDKHFSAIVNELKKKSEESIDNSLYMIIFYLLTVTELRPSNIISLRKNCVKETGPNIYILETMSKTSNKEIIGIPISIEVKRQIDEVIRITEKYRQENRNEETNKFLFITEGRRKNQYRVMQIGQFNKYLGKICDDLGIPKYTASNIRDTHMTKAEEFIIESNYSEMQQNILSGHKSSAVDEQFYVKTEKRTILEAVQGVHIGDKAPESSFTTKNNKQGVDEVRLNMLLTSERFITTTDFFDYFNNQLSEVDKEIISINSELNNNSSIERLNILINYKDLLEGYRAKILDINNGK